MIEFILLNNVLTQNKQVNAGKNKRHKPQMHWPPSMLLCLMVKRTSWSVKVSKKLFHVSIKLKAWISIFQENVLRRLFLYRVARFETNNSFS